MSDFVIAQIVEVCQPARVDGLLLLAYLLEDRRTAGELVAMQPQIKRGMGQLNALAHRSKEVVARCKQLQAQPSPKTPAGF